MLDVIYQAQAPLEFIPPAFNPLVLRGCHLLLPSWIRWQTAITQIEADNVEVLVDLYRQFQEGKIRLLLAFRHPKTEDPFCLGYLFSQIMPKVARKHHTPLQMPIHAHFIYDRGIPLWAGSHVGWIASRLGGTPIQRGKADWTGLRSARDLFAHGKFPMAAAPEGATNNLSEIISPLEPGIAQLGFWCAEDLQKQQRSEQVLIVPVGIKYSYVTTPWSAIADLLNELEVASGAVVNPSAQDQLPGYESLYPRLLSLAEHLLCLMEQFYKGFYHQNFADAQTIAQETSDRNQALAMRLQALLNKALHISEEYFGLQPKGQLNDRCRRVEQAGWNYIFREDFKDIKALSAVEKALGDRVANEANARMWHMRLVESFVAVSGSYIREKPTVERFAETTLILWQMITKIKGNKAVMPQLGKQRVQITIGQPISVSERYPLYKESRLTARQAVADLTNDLQQEMENLIRNTDFNQPPH